MPFLRISRGKNVEIESGSEADEQEDPSGSKCGSPCSTDSSSSKNCFGGQSSDLSDSPSPSETDESQTTDSKVQAQRQQLRRRLRTAKARETALLNKGRRKLARQGVLNPPPHPAEEYRHLLKAKSPLNLPGCTSQQRMQRLRLLVSYMRSWGLAIVAFFGGGRTDAPSEGRNDARRSKRINHTLITSVIDDTNIRLSASLAAAPHIKSSRVVSCMNHVQNVRVNFSPSSSVSGKDDSHTSQCKHFSVVTPMVCLPKANTEGIAAEFGSRLFHFLGNVSDRFRSFHIPQTILSDVPINATLCCSDALKTNVAVVKRIRSATHSKHMSDGYGAICPFLPVQCCIHQLALTRRPILVTGLPGLWSSIVRLGHLFEVASFRQQFRHALTKTISESFRYVAVPEVPADSADWKAQRIQMLGLSSNADLEAKASGQKRLHYHRELMMWDNSDTDRAEITHWCTGGCCIGENSQQRARHALLQIVKFYLVLYSFGYPVPLLYRWVHCGRAVQYVKET